MRTPAGVGPAPAPPPRVSSGAALVMLAAVLTAGALVAVGIGGLVGDVVPGVRRGRPVDSDQVVPANPAPVPGLARVAVDAPFAVPASSLPDLPSGAFQEVSGSWRVGEQGAQAQPSGRSSTMAVATAPDGATTVAVTLAVPRPGAGVVTGWTDPEHYVALVLDSSGRNVNLLRANGGDAPDVVLQAQVEAPGQELVLGLRLVEGRVEAIANGAVLGSRATRDLGDRLVGGMVAGPGRAGEGARFRDLVLG